MKELVASRVSPGDGDKKMNKVIKTIILTLIGAGCFSGGLYYGIERSEQYLESVMVEYEVISDKVYVFEKVSDPKTLRKHINDLNKILDDIDFLHILIENGQLADEALGGYFSEYDVKLNNIKEMLDNIYVMTEDNETKQGGQIEYSKTQIDNLWREAKLLEKKLKEQYDYTSELNITLQQSINDVKSEIDVIKKSKYGQKIWR